MSIVEDADDWEEYRDFLNQLVDRDSIQDSAVDGITKQVIAKGLSSLSEKQRFVFGRDVVQKFPQPRCDECHEFIPWSEAYEFFYGETRCGGCQNRYEKFMAED